MGGVSEKTTLPDGTPEQVEAEVREAIKETEGRRVLIAPGCSIPPWTPKPTWRRQPPRLARPNRKPVSRAERLLAAPAPFPHPSPPRRRGVKGEDYSRRSAPASTIGPVGAGLPPSGSGVTATVSKSKTGLFSRNTPAPWPEWSARKTVLG